MVELLKVADLQKSFVERQNTPGNIHFHFIEEFDIFIYQAKLSHLPDKSLSGGYRC